jgi:hypothetical protein
MAKKKAKTTSIYGDLAKPTMPKTVDIKKAKNGYIVSQYGMNGEQCYIANDNKEAQAYAAKLLK